MEVLRYCISLRRVALYYVGYCTPTVRLVGDLAAEFAGTQMLNHMPKMCNQLVL